MTPDELYALPLVVDLQTAGRAWGMSRSRVYAAHAADALPFRVVSVGGRLKVTRAALLRSLDMDEEPALTGSTVTTTDRIGPGNASPESHIRAV